MKREGERKQNNFYLKFILEIIKSLKDRVLLHHDYMIIYIYIYKACFRHEKES